MKKERTMFKHQVLLFFVLISLVCREAKGAPPNCKTDWIEYNGNCYKFMNETKLPWDDADASCRNQNSHLASIHSEHENQFIRDYTDKTDVYSVLQWIGLRGQPKEWRWIDNSTSKFMMKRFNEYGNCAFIVRDYSHEWFSVPCDNRKNCICKKATDTTYNCTENTEFYMESDDGNCYLVSKNDSIFENNWETCEEMCKTEGTHLATITSENENNFLFSFIKQLPIRGDGWIGLRAYPLMEWTDNSAVNYKGFADNQPAGQGSCIYHYHGVDNWSDEQCFYQYPFTCKITGSAPCKPGWLAYSTNCYYFSTEYLNWYEAEEYCNNNSSHLTSILDENEDDFIKNHLTSYSWIGINYWKFNELWTDGTIYDYGNFKSGHPSGKVPCIVVEKPDTDLWWIEDICYNPNYYVCKVAAGVIFCDPSQTALTNGSVMCTDNNQIGSVCTYTCNEGYGLSNISLINTICIDNGDDDLDGIWNSTLPQCTAITCESSIPGLTNGVVTCTNQHMYGSVCSYTCNEGYVLSDTSLINITCIDNGDDDVDGKWNSTPSYCNAITCESSIPGLTNGVVTCTNQHMYGSVCSYTCNEGYVLSDTSLINTTCIDNGDDDVDGKWNSTPPYCNVAVCEEEVLLFPSDNTTSVTFPKTKAGYFSNSVQTCSESKTNKFYANRLCKETSEWDDPVWISSCDVRLEDLTVTEPENVEEVASDLVILTSQPEKLTNSDVEVALNLVEEVLEVSPVVEQEIANLLVDSLSNLIKGTGTQNGEETTQTAKQILGVLDKVSSSINVTQGDFSRTSSQVSVYAASPGITTTKGLEFIPFKDIDETDSFRQGQILPLTNCSNSLNNSNICLTFTSPKNNSSKLTFYAFLNDLIFKPKVKSSDKVKSEVVLSATALGFDIEDVEMKFKFRQKEENKCDKNANYTCAYWNETSLKWKKFGNASRSEDFIECQTYHLTNFAALFSDFCDFGLDIVTIVGCSLSFLGQVATLVMHFKNKTKRRRKETSYASIHGVLLCNLAAALCLLNLLLVISEIPDIKQSPDGCQVIAIMLHFALISVFTCMSADTFHIFLGNYFHLEYRAYFNFKQFSSVSFLVPWGIPAVFIAASAGVNLEIYGGKNGQCWIIDEDWMTYLVIIPTSILLAFNLIMFACILYAARFKARPSGPKPYEKMRTLRIALVLFFTVGGTWIIGFIIKPLTNLSYQAGLALAYIFAILNSLQGAALFSLYYVSNRKEKVGKTQVKTATSSNHTSKFSDSDFGY